MSAVAARASLDRSLRTRGEDVVLRRRIGSGTPATYVEVAARAQVRGYAPEELVGGIAQGDSRMILSPTALIAAGAAWPGAAGGTLAPVKNDQVRLQRGIVTVQSVSPSYIGTDVVRFELQVRG